MLNRKLLLGVLIAASLGGAAVPAMARTNVDLIVSFAPPAPRYERVVPRAGYVWSPGYWNWASNRYVWVDGYWLPERVGYYWEAPRWFDSGHGWRYQPGSWSQGRRDYDHDGIPNYRDPTPYGRHYGTSYHYRDNDRDGIPNYRDRTPNGRSYGHRDSDRDGTPDYRDRRPYDSRR